MKSTRSVGALSTRAAFSPDTVNATRRTVDVVWTTGARVLRNSFWDGPSYEELSLDPAHVRMGRLNNGAPFLKDHRGQLDSVIGVVESARIENGKGVATVRFPAEGVSPEADKMFALVRDGILQNISVGYRTYSTEEVGKDGNIPVFRATDWEPHELSAVAIPADDSAKFRSADQSTQHQCVFVTREGSNMDAEELKKQADLARAEGAKQERERVTAIRAAVRAGGLDVETEKELIDGGKSVDEARAVVLSKLAAKSESEDIRGHQPVITMGETDFQAKMRGMEAALTARVSAGVIADAVKQGKKGFEKLDLDGGQFRGLSLLDACRHMVEARGVNTRNMSSRTVVETALTQRSTNGLAPASDFAILYQNVMGKILLAAYATAPDSWRLFSKVDTVKDYRASPRYRVGSFGVLDSVGEGEEYKSKSLPDGNRTDISVAKKGNIIGLTREAIIADDMGANADIMTRFGRSAGLSIESDVYALLAANSGLGSTQSDTNPFFHSSRANVGTAAAISVAALDADRIVMAQQMDISSNEYLDLKPSVLLVPITLGSTAKRLNLAEFDNDGTALMKPNVVKGLFGTVVESARLSGTRRYLFTDPSVAPAIVVAFLEGTGEAPFMEQHEEFRRDGISMKLRIEYKAQMFDPKGAVTNAGA